MMCAKDDLHKSEPNALSHAQGVSDEALHAALAAAAAADRAGHETEGTILLEILSAVDNYGLFAGYMAGEADLHSQRAAVIASAGGSGKSVGKGGGYSLK